MENVYVIYWSQTGNTKAMADAIAKGIEEAGAKAYLLEVSNANVEDLKEAKAFALGCPAMGAEVLEESEMEPFVEALTKFVEGKNVALFGSYGWGDGEWMRDWVERMEGAGANVINNEGIICQEMPDDEAIAACEVLGKEVALLA